MKKITLMEILVLIAILLIISAIIVPRLVPKPKVDAAYQRWAFTGHQDLEGDDSVDFYLDKRTGLEIACVHGKLADSPSCFVDNPVK